MRRQPSSLAASAAYHGSINIKAAAWHGGIISSASMAIMKAAMAIYQSHQLMWRKQWRIRRKLK